MLEGVDPLGHHFGHFIEYLLAPPGNRHMERIVGRGSGRLVVPGLNRGQQGLVRRGQTEIHHHGSAAREGCTRTRFKIITRIGAHERHFEMGVRVNPARHHIASGGIQRFIATQPCANFGNLAIFDKDIAFVGAVSSNNRTVFNNCAHDLFSQLQSSTIPAVSTMAWNSTSAPAVAQSLVISSASLCDSPSTQGHMTIAVGAIRLIQHAS